MRATGSIRDVPPEPPKRRQAQNLLTVFYARHPGIRSELSDLVTQVVRRRQLVGYAEFCEMMRGDQDDDNDTDDD